MKVVDYLKVYDIILPDNIFIIAYYNHLYLP